ncbi:MAG TPA: M23 family metallopeptidase, partial [Bacteroidia bacterium]|nr:M23 family metallopeptidase [Bacteroidia bacterium]
MELFRKFLCILLFGGLILLAESTAFAQYRSDVFSSPLQIPLKLAGNFCEIRSNHFHSGLDFKTNGAEGQPVFTACEGWISRIKVSTSGFGRVVYINHPQGYTTVYAHLSSFCDPVAALVDSIQRANQSYEMEFFPDSSRFPVIKHQLIGISGNSGGSQAPHLHFEIRDRYSEEPLNPMGFGLPIADTIAPNISKIAWYVERNGNFIQVGSNAISIYNKTESDTFHVCEDVYYAAFSGIDTDSTSSLGIYSIAFIADKDTIYKVKFDRFNFSESKLVNAYIDYKELKLRKTEMQRCFKTEGNTFSVFKKIKNRGVQILDYIPVDCRLVVTDFYGNSSSYNWVFQADSIADSLLRDFQS